MRAVLMQKSLEQVDSLDPSQTEWTSKEVWGVRGCDQTASYEVHVQLLNRLELGFGCRVVFCSGGWVVSKSLAD